jgi:hypothetical protein
VVNAPGPRGSGYDYPPSNGYPTSVEAPTPAVGSPSAAWDKTSSDWDTVTHTTASNAPRSASATRALGSSRQAAARRAATTEKGSAAWVAIAALIIITLLGCAIDLIRGAAVKDAFNIALVVGSILAILMVRRRSMFPVVVAPPLVYFVASAVLLYVRSNGLSDRSRLIDAAINWLVYGFPAIAGATAAVLIIAGIRMITRR